MNTNTYMKNIIFIFFTVLCVLLSAFFLCSTVVCQSSENAAFTEETYINLERDFINNMRTTLTDMGYENCGINLTRCVEACGERQYRITLHHKYLERLTESELTDLYTTLSSDAFLFDNCSFSFSLI